MARGRSTNPQSSLPGSVAPLLGARQFCIHLRCALFHLRGSALTLCLTGLLMAVAPASLSRGAGDRELALVSLPVGVYLPLMWGPSGCEPIPWERYGTLSVNPPPTDRPAEEHADLNLALRGYALTDAYKGLVDYGGESDAKAPQLLGLFADQRLPAFTSVYRVHDWDWPDNRPGGLITNPPVTLLGLAARSGEAVHVPDSGYSIGDGYEVLVLYACPERITLKFTREDNVVRGYTVHLEHICVEPTLLALYSSCDATARAQLPALRARQALGRARGDEIGVAIRDHGGFMDPRSRKDWWQGVAS